MIDDETLRSSPLDGEPTAASKSPRSLRRGTMLGRYVVLGFLGEGGMATVYSALDPDLDRKVAIKLLKGVGDGAREARELLLREAQAMARVSHPNVVPVFDAGSFGEQLFVAMELEEGQTLGAWLASRPRSRQEILRAFISAGEGLAAAHAVGVIHRDFKPENVLVGRQGRVLVSDLGLARFSGESGIAEIAGTPAYMPPEQFRGEEVDARSDQFSFCAALWEALCGYPPHEGEDFETLRGSVLAGRRRPAPKSVPRWLLRHLARGLSARREDRFPKMEDLLAALQRDPLARAKRIGLAVGVAFALLALAAFGARLAWRERHRCALEAQRLAGETWTAERRAQAQAGFSAAGYSPHVGTALLAKLDGWFEEWQRWRREACELERQGKPDASLALGCLEQQREDARAAVLTMASPRSGLALGLTIDELPWPQTCVERAAEQAARPLADRSDLRKEAKEVWTMGRLGLWRESGERARAGLERALAAGALAETAKFENALGSSLARTQGASQEAERLLRQAVLDADGAAHDDLSLRARLTLARYYLDADVKLEKAEEVLLQAGAWLKRLGSPPQYQYLHETELAFVAGQRWRHEEAAKLLERAVASSERAFGPSSPRVAAARANLAAALSALGRYAEAVAESREALRLLEAAPWRSPVGAVGVCGNLAWFLVNAGQPGAALEAIDAAGPYLAQMRGEDQAARNWLASIRMVALEQLGRAGEAESIFASLSIDSLPLFDGAAIPWSLAAHARCLVALGRPDEALAAAEEAVRQVDRSSETNVRAAVRATAAQALFAAQKDRPRAEALARQALEELNRPEDGWWRGSVERWLGPYQAVGERTQP